jgi:hypothetical protein
MLSADRAANTGCGHVADLLADQNSSAFHRAQRPTDRHGQLRAILSFLADNTDASFRLFCWSNHNRRKPKRSP